MEKMPFFLHGEVASWEIVIWEVAAWKLLIWEVATWEVALGKMPLGKYLMPILFCDDACLKISKTCSIRFQRYRVRKFEFVAKTQFLCF